MWRTQRRRRESAKARLRLAAALWGWTPHRGQAKFFSSVAQVRVAACGRRWGKTEALSVDIATLALDEARRGRPCRQLVVAPTDAQARLIGGATLDRLERAQESPDWPAGLTVRARRTPTLQVTLHTPPSEDGKEAGPAVALMAFRTAGRDGRGLRGLGAHRVVVDEAGYVPDAVLDEVLLPMLADDGGELVLASSPAGRRSAYYRCFARGMGGGGRRMSPGTLSHPDGGGQGGHTAGSRRGGVTYESFQCPSTDNRHLDRAWLSALREDMGESRYAQEVLAQFVDDYGAVFPAGDIDGCLQEDGRVTTVNTDLVSAPQTDRWYTAGVDWGRKRDFTVVCLLDATARPARLVGLWRMQGTGWEAQAARVGQIVAAFGPRKVLADGSGVGDPVAERLAQEIRRQVPDGGRVPPVERFLFAGESKLRLVDHLTLGLSARALTYPYHRALLGELRAFEYGESAAGGRPRTAARGGGHDDCVMALALAWYCAPDAAPPAPSSLLLLGSSVGVSKREA